MKQKSAIRIVVTILMILLEQNLLAAQSVTKDTSTANYVNLTIDIPQLSRQRLIQIYLPDGYTVSSKKYPVIYMQDGQNLYNKAGSNPNSWSVDSVLKQFPADKQAIIVGINHGEKFRLTEYNAYDSRFGKGEGVAYTDFIVKTLKPFIDKHYRTMPDAKHTAIAGSSMGGLISMYAATKYADVFGTAGIFSPSFWIAPQIYADGSNQAIPSKSRFFLACGDAEGNEADHVNKMDSILRSKGFNLKNVPKALILKNAKHNEQQWRAEFPVFYQWFISRL